MATSKLRESPPLLLLVVQTRNNGFASWRQLAKITLACCWNKTLDAVWASAQALQALDQFPSSLFVQLASP